MAARDRYPEDDPLWYKDAVIYELHIKSFHDSNGDGIGDFRGLIEKLDYLEGLGVNTVWLLPFYPSPLRDDGYDIAYYFDVHPNYGTLKDFREFLREAHRRGMRVITELVINHTSDQHPWFQRARKAKPGSAWRDYYVWSDTPEKYSDTRIIFKDFESSNWTWDPVAKSYYWHRFYSHQPDLNFDNPNVQNSVINVLENWLKAGVDGVRLDAVPYLYEREGTNCENLPETHEFLKKLRRHVDGRFKNRMFLAEANQWPENAAAYFGNGDECQMAFHFPLMPRLFMAIQMEDRFPIIDILDQTPPIGESCQWALFLRNHDELTLEMVTDEERDYMYRVYARDPRTRINLGIRRRLSPLVGNDRRKIELMNILLFSLPGTPIIYYGDEIGMGDNYYLGDRDGVRTPMQWSADRNAGFSRANPQKLYLPVIIDPEYHYEAINVENQDGNPNSLLWWMKRAIAMRKKLKSLSRGDLRFLKYDNPKVLAFVRSYGDEAILVVINLSRFSQAVQLDLSGYEGCTPVEVFSRNRFPGIRDSNYILTLGPHDYYWFIIEREEAVSLETRTLYPELAVKFGWDSLFNGRMRERLEDDILPGYMRRSRWFGGKGKTIREIRIEDTMPLTGIQCRILIIGVTYVDGSSDYYLLPVSFVSGDGAKRLEEETPAGIIAKLVIDKEEGFLCDGAYERDFHDFILQTIVHRKKIKGDKGLIAAYPGKMLRKLFQGNKVSFPSQIFKSDQSNTSVLYDGRLFLKLYRRIDEGINPDSEMIRHLTERTEFRNIPVFAGQLEYHRPGYGRMALGLLQEFVPNQGDAWTYTLDSLRQYFDQTLSRKTEMLELPRISSSVLDERHLDIPQVIQEVIGGVYMEFASLLGKRTGEMHLALSSHTGEPDFDAEPFSMLYQRSLYQSMRGHTRRVLQLLEGNIKKLPDLVREEAAEILGAEDEILGRFRTILGRKISATKMRYHGDLHLGQVLNTGKDVIIIDFEGEPARSLGERRLKRSPLRDVAGMIRSFHYAAHSCVMEYLSTQTSEAALLESWAETWYHYMSRTFLSSYISTVNDAHFIPKDREELKTLLQVFLLDKAVYELAYELNNRPDMIMVPIKGIREILKKF